MVVLGRENPDRIRLVHRNARLGDRLGRGEFLVLIEHRHLAPIKHAHRRAVAELLLRHCRKLLVERVLAQRSDDHQHFHFATVVHFDTFLIGELCHADLLYSMCDWFTLLSLLTVSTGVPFHFTPLANRFRTPRQSCADS